MLACVRTAAVFGVEASPVQVEVDVSFGLPSFTMVGLPDASVRESRDRVRSAIRNSGFEFPPHRVTVNLAPADSARPARPSICRLRSASWRRPAPSRAATFDDVLVIGELSLDGGIQPTRGVLPVAAAARRDRIRGVLLPAANHAEAAVVSGLDLYPVAALTRGGRGAERSRGIPRVGSHGTGAAARGPPGRTVTSRTSSGSAGAAGAGNCRRRGTQHPARRPPGGGQDDDGAPRRRHPAAADASTKRWRRRPFIRSPACWPPATACCPHRPFRAPHHTDLGRRARRRRPPPAARRDQPRASRRAVPRRDGGVQPARRWRCCASRSKKACVRIARAARTVVFPARFMLVGAMNPCPCGFHGTASRPCRCTPLQIARYASRLSGPLRDRIDLTVQVGRSAGPRSRRR